MVCSTTYELTIPIRYKSENGYSGVLYNKHRDDWTGEWNYSMRIYDSDGKEVLHAYNAKPKTLGELAKVVDGFEDLRSVLIRVAEEYNNEN